MKSIKRNQSKIHERRKRRKAILSKGKMHNNSHLSYGYLDILNSINEIFIFYDNHFNIITVNRHFYNVFGYERQIPPGDFSMERLFDFYFAFEGRKALLDSLFINGRLNNFTCYMRAEDHSVVFVEINASALYDSQGQPMGAVALIRETFDRSLFLQRLKESEYLYRSMFEYANIPIFIWNEKGYFQDANTIGLKLLGYPISDLRDKSIEDISPENAKEILKHIHDEHVYQGETTFYTVKGQPCYMELSAFIIQNPQLTLIYGFGIDITERKELEALREDHFHLLNHDLKSPITAILGYSELLEETVNNPMIDKLNFVQEIHDAANQMLEMVRVIQDINKLENDQLILNYEKVNLFNILEVACRNVNPVAKKRNIEIALFNNGNPHQYDDQYMVEVDQTQFLRVCNNLLTNAVESAYKHSTIRIFLQDKGDEFSLCFKNKGKPLSEEAQSRMFHKFSTYGKKAGSGLGTYGVKLITTAHKGKVNFQAEGENIQFTLVYPKKMPL